MKEATTSDEIAAVHRGTVYVSIDRTTGRYTWACGCGQSRSGYLSERRCREDGLEHQQTGKPSREFGAPLSDSREATDA